MKNSSPQPNLKEIAKRRDYLLGLDENAANFLTMGERYDRICYLRQIEASRHLKRMGYLGKEPSNVVALPRAPTAAKTLYKSWMND